MEPLRIRVSKRPISEEIYKRISDRMSHLTHDQDDFFIIELAHDREHLLFVQGIRHGDKIETEIGFDMSDWGWDKNLLLGCELRLSEAKKVIHSLLVKNEISGNNEIISHRFRRIDYEPTK